MNVQKGISREQMWMMSLEMEISQDSVVRLIDLFVNHLDVGQLGFTKSKANKEGCPIYQASDMLKLYYYGYFNRIRSSRKLAAECSRNIELWWLLHQLKPGYHTIADFRKNNAVALKKSFKMFVAFLKGEDLLGGELVAIDGTKIRAQNNKSNNYNESKLAKHLAYIEAKAESYIQELEQGDATEDKQAAELNKKQVVEKLKILEQRKTKYEELQKRLEESKAKQISTVDADSRSLPLKDGITDVCYNIQSANDSKHSLVVDFDTTNKGDQGQLNTMATRAKEAMEAEHITVLADKGYHVGRDLKTAKENEITTIVAYPQSKHRSAQIHPDYYTDKFVYNKQSDSYTCPAGCELTTNGNLITKGKKDRTSYVVKTYTTSACSTCPFRKLCTKSASRKIDRSEYQDTIDENNKRVDENAILYKQRQQIVEHPFGTIKRSWGYSYTLLKGLNKVNGEMALIFTIYNLRRVMSILGVSELKKRLAAWKSSLEILKQSIISSFLTYKTIWLQLATKKHITHELLYHK